MKDRYIEDCFKLTPKLSIIKLGDDRHITIQFNDSIPLEKWPEHVKIYFTSEKNSYGIIGKKWIDGDEWFVLLKLGWTNIELRPEKYTFLKTKLQCSDISYYECFESILAISDFELFDGIYNCSKKCFPVSLPDKKSYFIPFCEKNETDCASIFTAELLTKTTLGMILHM